MEKVLRPEKFEIDRNATKVQSVGNIGPRHSRIFLNQSLQRILTS